MLDYEKELVVLQKGYDVKEKAFIRIGWEQAFKLVEEKLKSTNTESVQCLLKNNCINSNYPLICNNNMSRCFIERHSTRS